MRVITFGPAPYKRVEPSTENFFYLSPKSCRLICSAFFWRAYFFWLCKFALMLLSFFLFSVLKICILVVKFYPFLSLKWYKHSHRIPKIIQCTFVGGVGISEACLFGRRVGSCDDWRSRGWTQWSCGAFLRVLVKWRIIRHPEGLKSQVEQTLVR